MNSYDDIVAVAGSVAKLNEIMKDYLATLLNIDISRFMSFETAAGSIVVTFRLSPPASSSEPSENDLVTQLQQLVTSGAVQPTVGSTKLQVDKVFLRTTVFQVLFVLFAFLHFSSRCTIDSLLIHTNACCFLELLRVFTGFQLFK
jgi:hypothetical protein